jgi:hypothetical protein
VDEDHCSLGAIDAWGLDDGRDVEVGVTWEVRTVGDRRPPELDRGGEVSATGGSFAGAANTVDEEEEEEGADPIALEANPDGAGDGGSGV